MMKVLSRIVSSIAFVGVCFTSYRVLPKLDEIDAVSVGLALVVTGSVCLDCLVKGRIE